MSSIDLAHSVESSSCCECCTELSGSMKWGICLAENLLASQERLCCMEKVITFVHCKPNFIQHPAVKVNCKCRGIIGDHQSDLECNRSTVDRIFCTHQIFEKEMGIH